MTIHFPHFTVVDLVRSNTAHERGIPNELKPELVENGIRTLTMAEAIRAELCRQAGRDIPVSPSSIYRCGALNWVVRNPHAVWTGQEDWTGDHPKCAAIDFTAPAFGTPIEICRALVPHLDALGIGQLIQEGTWVHASWMPQANPINRVITKLAGGGYAPGLQLA
jgi:hypothetical protein